MLDPSREQNPDAVPSRFPIIFYILLLAISVFLIVFFTTADIQRVLSVVPDDAAYYFKIAENVTAGKGLTFDGLNQTNGFQPLWLYTIIPVSAIYRGNPETMFRLYLIIQVVIVAVSLLLIFLLHSRTFPGETVTISVVIFLFMVFMPAVNGMESAILVLTLSILYMYGWYGKVFHRYSPGKSFVFGLILGLCVLSRLDTIFLALTIGLFLCIAIIAGRGKRREDFQRLVLIVLGAVVLVLPYLLFNLIKFGGVVPINGALKSSFPAIHEESLNVFKVNRRFLLSALLAVLYAVWYVLKGRISKTDKTERSYFRVGMAVLSVAVILHLLHTLLFMKWGTFNWHFISYALFTSLVICEPVNFVMDSRRIRKLRGWLFWFVLIVLLMFGGKETAERFNRDLDYTWNVAAYKAAVWARNNSTTSDVFAMSDAGNFGYFSERAVINLDGVVNNLDYQKALNDKKLKEYLEKRKVKYISQHGFWYQDEINRGGYETFPWKYFSHKYSTKSDAIMLREDDEVYRSKPYYDGSHRTVFVIWKWSR